MAEAGAVLGEGGGAGACCTALGNLRAKKETMVDGGWCVVMMVAYYITI